MLCVRHLSRCSLVALLLLWGPTGARGCSPLDRHLPVSGGAICLPGGAVDFSVFLAVKMETSIYSMACDCRLYCLQGRGMLSLSNMVLAPDLLMLKDTGRTPIGVGEQEDSMAAYRSEYESFRGQGIPPLEDLEVGKPVGAILPMSERAQLALRDSIELIDFLINQDDVTWN